MKPSELLQIFDQVGNYYRWFHVSTKELKSNKLDNKLKIDMKENCFIDGLKYQGCLSNNAIQAVVEYINALDIPEDQYHPINIAADYILGIKKLLDIYKTHSNLHNDEEMLGYRSIETRFYTNQNRNTSQ